MKDNKMVQSNNAFVRAEQAKMKKHMGNRPVMKKEMEEFDAYNRVTLSSSKGEGKATQSL